VDLQVGAIKVKVSPEITASSSHQPLSEPESLPLAVAAASISLRVRVGAGSLSGHKNYYPAAVTVTVHSRLCRPLQPMENQSRRSGLRLGVSRALALHRSGLGPGSSICYTSDSFILRLASDKKACSGCIQQKQVKYDGHREPLHYKRVGQPGEGLRPISMSGEKYHCCMPAESQGVNYWQGRSAVD
jgi:hypothetical protein